MYKKLLILVLIHLTAAKTSLADYLWEETTAFRNQALDSTYINGIRDICLDPSDFGGHMVDDTVYLKEGSVSFKKAADRSNDSLEVQNFLTSEATKWEEYWVYLADVWHIKNVGGIKLGEAASNYINYIRKVAEEEDPVYTVLALTPCAKLWPWLGQQIGSDTKNFGVYTTWVKENLNSTSTGYKEFEEIVQVAYDNDIVTIEKAKLIFSESMENEVQFFNSVTECESDPISGSATATSVSGLIYWAVWVTGLIHLGL